MDPSLENLGQVTVLLKGSRYGSYKQRQTTFLQWLFNGCTKNPDSYKISESLGELDFVTKINTRNGWLNLRRVQTIRHLESESMFDQLWDELGKEVKIIYLHHKGQNE